MSTSRYLPSLSLLLGMIVLVGCAGAPRTAVIGTDEVTSIVLVGNLQGGTVELSNGFRHTITKEDLQKSISNIYSVKDSPSQKAERVVLNVDPGDLSLTFTRPDGRVLQRRLFVSPGVVNEVRLN